jgi:outer-membrane lipoprotein carrier protein|nr:LolA-like outer membrane lipoprotein chaperone [uncultured Campylobacter sp.]
MKKTLISLAASCVFVFAGGIEFNTLSANFSQTVQSDDAKISYGGDFSATKEHAVWHYKTPTIKNIFFSFTKVVVIEPELEQAIITNIKETPNLTAILANAKPNKNGVYEASFDDVKYLIELKGDLPSKISYTDKMDNKVVINLSNVRKNAPVNEAIFKPAIPKNYDIITQ